MGAEKLGNGQYSVRCWAGLVLMYLYLTALCCCVGPKARFFFVGKVAPTTETDLSFRLPGTSCRLLDLRNTTFES